MEEANKITKNVDITVDVKTAKIMLGVAGYAEAKNLSDDEIVKLVLSMLDCYGVVTTIK